VSKPELSGWEALGQFVGSVALGFGLGVWHAYVLTVLWSWFMVPQFALAPLSLGHGFGLCIIWRLMRGVPTGPAPDYAEAITKGALFPAITLFFGWIVHACIA
jgi:hypothetical protein